MGSPRTTNENKMRVYQQHENEDDSASLLYKVPHVNDKHSSPPTDVRKLFQRSISLPKLLRKLSFTKRVASKKANNNDNGANDNDSDDENEMESSNHEQENSDKNDKSNKTKNYSKRRSKSKSSSPQTIQKQNRSDDELRLNSAKDIVASALIALGKQSEKTYTSLSKKRNRRKRDDERNKTKNNKTDTDQHDDINDNDDDATSVTQDFSHDDSSNSSHLSPLPPFQKYFDDDDDDDDDDDVESIRSDTEHFDDNQDDDDDSSTSSGSVITEDGPLSFDGDDGDYFNIDSDDDDDLLADLPPTSPKKKTPNTTKQGRKVTFRPSVTCYTNKRKLSEQDIRNGWWSKAHVNKRAIDAAHAVQTYMTEQPESVENLLMVFDLCEQACTMNELESGPAKLALVSLRNVRGLEMSICPELKELIQDYREEMMEYYYDGIPESASTETQGKLLAKKSRELSKPFKRMARVMAQADEYLVKLG